LIIVGQETPIIIKNHVVYQYEIYSIFVIYAFERTVSRPYTSVNQIKAGVEELPKLRSYHIYFILLTIYDIILV
jgi:hypothetical protein